VIDSVCVKSTISIRIVLWSVLLGYLKVLSDLIVLRLACQIINPTIIGSFYYRNSLYLNPLY